MRNSGRVSGECGMSVFLYLCGHCLIQIKVKMTTMMILILLKTMMIN